MSQEIIFIIDTNFFFNLIKASKEFSVPYKEILFDFSVYMRKNSSFLFIPEAIMKELGQIVDVKEFDHDFSKIRANNPRINFFTNPDTQENNEFRKILQPLFKGNISKVSGKEDLEEADHELIVCALNMANKYPDSQIQIISDDYQVLDISNNLGEHLRDIPKKVLNQINSFPGFHFTYEILISNHDYKTDMSQLHDYIFEIYNNRRKSQNNEKDTIKWLRTDQEFTINKFKKTFPEINNLRESNRQLNNDNEKYKQFVDQSVKKSASQDEFTQKLENIIKLILSGSISEDDIIRGLEQSNLDKFTDLFAVFREIQENKDLTLVQRFFRSWGKVLNGVDRQIALNVRKEIYSSVFKSLIKSFESVFKSNKINKSFNLYSQMLPLEIEMDWKVSEDRKLLEKFYSIGLYLSLIKDRFDEFYQIIEITKIAEKERELENSTLKQFILFSNLIKNPNQSLEITKIFKSDLLQNAEVFYKSRHWYGVWYLLLPLYSHLNTDELKKYKGIIENTYWATLGPPKELDNMWNEVNKEFEIIKGNNIGKPLSDVDISTINKQEVIPDFLQGKHLVVDKSVGRAHIVIHISGRHRRLGLQIRDENINLHQCLEVEFENNSLPKHIKCSSDYKDELKNKISGILKFKSGSIIKPIIRERNLNNLII